MQRNEARGSEATRGSGKAVKRLFRDVDVGWERSEPMNNSANTYFQVLAVANSHDAEKGGTKNRFRLTETIYMILKCFAFIHKENVLSVSDNTCDL